MSFIEQLNFLFLRPHLRQFIAECGNCHLFIHKFIISHSAVFGTFFLCGIALVILLKKPSIKFNQEPCVGVKTNVNRPSGLVAR